MSEIPIYNSFNDLAAANDTQHNRSNSTFSGMLSNAPYRRVTGSGDCIMDLKTEDYPVFKQVKEYIHQYVMEGEKSFYGDIPDGLFAAQGFPGDVVYSTSDGNIAIGKKSEVKPSGFKLPDGWYKKAFIA